MALLIGGRSDVVLKRVARHARFWQTTSIPAAEFPSYVAKIRAEPGGDRVEVGATMAFSGDLNQARATIDEWTAAGAQHLSVNFGAPDSRVERMQAFARELL